MREHAVADEVGDDVPDAPCTYIYIIPAGREGGGGSATGRLGRNLLLQRKRAEGRQMGQQLS